MTQSQVRSAWIIGALAMATATPALGIDFIHDGGAGSANFNNEDNWRQSNNVDNSGDPDGGNDRAYLTHRTELGRNANLTVNTDITIGYFEAVAANGTIGSVDVGAYTGTFTLGNNNDLFCSNGGSLGGHFYWRAPGGNVHIGAELILDGDLEITMATGTLTFGAGASDRVRFRNGGQTHAWSGNRTFARVVIDTSTTVRLTSDVTVHDIAVNGALDLDGHILTVTGNLTVGAGGTINSTTASSGVTFQGATATQVWNDSSPAPGQNYGAVSIDKSAGVVQLATAGNGVQVNTLTFVAATNGDLDLNGEQLSLSGLGVDAPLVGLSAATQIIDSNGGTSTIRFAGTPAGATVQVPVGNIVYEALVFEGPASNTSYTIQANLTTQILSVTRGALSLNGLLLDATSTTSQATVGADGSVTTGAGGELQVGQNLELDGTFNGAGGTLDVNNSIVNSTGVLNMGTGALELVNDADLTAVTVTFDPAGVLRLDGTGALVEQIVVVDGGETFGLLDVVSLTTSVSRFDKGGAGDATVSFTGVTVRDGGRIGFDGTSPGLSLTVNGTTTVGQSGTGLLSLGLGATFNGTFTAGAGGTFTQNAAPVTFAGDVTLTAMTAANYTTPGDVTFSRPTGTDQAVALPAGTVVFDDVIVNRPASTDVVAVSGAGTWQARTLTATRGVLRVDTDTTVPNGPTVTGLTVAADGRFEVVSGTARAVSLLAADGANISVLVNAGGEFVVTGAAHVLTFDEGEIVDVNGGATTLFTIDGATLRDPLDDTTRWIIDMDAGVNYSVSNATIMDSQATGTGAPLVAAASTLNDTLGWLRGRFWRGTTTNWSTPGNWLPNDAAPSSTEVAIFDIATAAGPSTGIGTLPTPGQLGGLRVYAAYAGTVAIDAALVLNGDLTFDGTGNDAQVSLGTFNLEVDGNVSLTNLGGAFGTGTGVLIMDRAGAAALTLGGPSTIGVAFQVGDTGPSTNTQVTLPQALTVNGALTVVTGSTLTLGGHLLTAPAGLTVAGTLNATGGVDGETGLDVSNLAVTGVFQEGNEDTRVSGNLSVTGTWTDDPAGEVIFDGAALVGSPQTWASSVPLGGVRLASVANGYVRLSGAASAGTIIVETGDALDTGASTLTVTTLLDVNAGGFLVGGNGAPAVDTLGLTIAGTYTEGTGNTHVSGNLTVSGTWTNNTGVLVFDGSAVTQDLDGSGLGTSGVGEVSIAGNPNPTTVRLVNSNATVTTLTGDASNDALNLNGRTLTVLGGAANPPLDLVDADDLTGAGTVIVSRPGGSDTSLDALNYPNLQLTRSSGAAAAQFRPAGASLASGGAFQVGAGASYTTADAGATQRPLTVTGATTLNGGLVAAGPVALTFTGGLTTTAGASLQAGAGGAVGISFAGPVTLAGSTFTHTNGTATFDGGAGSLALSAGSGNTFNLVTVQNDTDVNLTGAFSASGLLTVTGSNTTLTGGSAATVSAPAVTINGPGAALAMGTGALTVNGPLTITQGTVTIGSGGADLNGDVTFGGAGTGLTLAGNVSLSGDLNLTNAAAFSQGGTLTFDGGAPGGAAGTQTLTLTGAGAFNGNVVVDLVDNADSATPDTLIVGGAAGSWSVGGTLTVTDGVLSLRRPSTITGVTSVAAGGRLENRDVAGLTHTFGAAVSIADAGQFDFGGPATGLTLTFQANQTVAVGSGAAAQFRIEGGAGAGAITLQSSSAGTAWRIDAFDAGSVVVSRIVLRDSNNISGFNLTATTSQNATPATNLDWTFPPKTTVWTGGGGGDTNWSTSANWTDGPPNPGDTAEFTQLVATNSTQDIDYGASSIAALLLGGTGQFTGTLTLNQDLRVAGATTVNAGATLSAGARTLTATGGLTVGGVLDAAGVAPGTAIDAGDLTITGTYNEGPRDTLVSGNVSVSGIWNEAAGRLIFDGAAVVGTPQTWTSSISVGAVRVESTTDGYVRLAGPAAASTVVVATGDTLDTGAATLTVSTLLDVNGGGTLLGGAGPGPGAPAIDTVGLTIAGTYGEGTGSTRVSGDLTVPGTWNNDTTGLLIFDGSGVTQDWNGSGLGAAGVGEVSIAGAPNPTTLRLITSDSTALTITATVANNVLNLNGRTLTILGNGGATPPLDLFESDDLTGTGTVVLSTAGGTTTAVGALGYPNLRLVRASGVTVANFRPATGAASITATGTFQVNVGAAYSTADGAAAQVPLAVTGLTTLDGGALTAAGPVALTFTGGLTTTATAGTSLWAGAGGAVGMTFGGAVTLANSTVSHTAGTATFDRGPGALALAAGTGNAFSAVTVKNDTDVSVTGALTANGLLSVSGSNTTLTASGAATITGAGVTVSGNGASLTMSTGALTNNGPLTLTQGTVTLGAGGGDLNGAVVTFGGSGTRDLTLAGPVTLSGDLDLTGASAFAQSGTLTFDGGAPPGAANTQTVTLTGTGSFNGAIAVNLVDSADSATPDMVVVAGAGAWTVGGAVTVTQGVLSVRRPSTFTGVTTVAGAGRLENRHAASLTHAFGAAVTIQDAGEFRFGGASANGLTLTFQAGQTVTVGPTGPAAFEVLGGAGSGAITLQSSTPGLVWLIDAFSAASVSVDSVTLRDSSNQSNVPPGPVIALTATSSFDATPATTLNWTFPQKNTSWTGLGLADTNWTNPANWDPGIPNRGDDVRFDRLVATNSTLNIDFGATGIASLLLGGTGQFTGTLTFNQPLLVSGATTVNAGSTLALSGNLLTADGGLTVGGTLNATGGTDGQTVLDVTDFTVVAVTGLVLDGNEDLRVSGNLSMAGAWTDVANSEVIFDGAKVAAAPQLWSSATSIGAVRVESTADGYVRLSAGASASSVVVASGDTLDLSGSQLTVAGLTDVAAGGVLQGGTAATSLRTGGLTVAGTYTEGTGDTRVSAALTVSGTWTNDPDGDLVFDGTTTQDWNGSGTGPNGVGEVVLAGDPTPTTVRLVTANPSVITLTSTVANNVLDLNGRTLTVFGNGGATPPLDLFEADDLTGTGTVTLQRTGGSTTLLDALAYDNLQLTRVAAGGGVATYQPQGAALTVGGNFLLAVSSAYSTADAGSTQRNLTINGATTLDGDLTAAGPVTLAFGDGGGDTTTISGTGSLTAGATGTVTATFAHDVSVAGAMNLDGGQPVNATFSRDLVVTGTLLHAAGTVTLDRGGNNALALTLAAGNSFNALTVQGDTNCTLTGNLVVTGPLVVSGGGTSFVLAGAANTVSVGSLQVTGADDASFSMAGSSGLLTVGGALTVSQGVVTLGAGGADVNGAVSFGNAGAVRSLQMAGVVNLAGNLAGADATAFTAPATLLLDGNAQTITLTSVVRTFNGLTVNQTGGLPTLAVNGGGNTFTTGALLVTAGAVTLGATTTTDVTSLTVNGGSLVTGANTVTATGLTSVTGGLTVSTGGVFRPHGGLSVVAGGAFTNDGTLRFAGGAPTWTDAGPTGSFGVVEVQTGTNLATGSSLVCASLTQTGGALTIANTHTLTVTGAASLTTGGTLTIDATGALECRGGLDAATPLSFNNSGTLRFTTAAQTWTGNVLFGAVVISGANVSTTTNLTTSGLACQAGGQLSLGVGSTLLTVRGNLDLASLGGGSLVMGASRTLRFEAAAGAPTFTFNRGTAIATTIGNLETALTGSATSLKLEVVAGVLVGGTLSVPANTEVEAQGALFRVTGVTTIGGTSSRLDLRAATRFDQRVDINSGGTLEVEANASFLGAIGGICVNVASGAFFRNDVTPVTLTFLQGATLNVVGTVVVAPDSGLTDLTSDTPGQRFKVEIGGAASQTFNAVRVRDSDGNAEDGSQPAPPPGPNATATSGTELSNVVDWAGLTAAEFAWTGLVDDDWSNGGNYTGPTPGVPFAGARLVFGTDGDTRPAPFQGTMPDLGEIDIQAAYAPAGNTVIRFTGAQTLEGGLAANSAGASINLNGQTLIVNGNLQALSTPISGAGSLVALQGTAQTIDVNGALLSIPLRVGNGVGATTATMVRALQVPELTVSLNSTLATGNLAVVVNGQSTIDGGLNAGTSTYTAQGSFLAAGAGAVTFTDVGTLSITGAGTLSAGAEDQLRNLSISANVAQGGAAVIDVDGALNVTAGTFTLTNGLNLAGAVDLTGGTLAPGASSLVTLDGTGARTLTLSADPFRNLTVAASVGTVMVSGDMQVLGDLQVLGGALNLQTNDAALTVGGTTALTGALTGGATSTTTLTGAVTVNTGGGSLSVTPFSLGGALTANGPVTLNGAGTIGGDVTGTTGTITLGAALITAGGDWTFSGTQTPGGSTVRFTKGTAAQVRGAFNHVELQGAGGVQLAADVTARQVVATGGGAGPLVLVDAGNVGRTLRLTGNAANPLQVPAIGFVGFTAGPVLGTVLYETSVGSTIPALGYGNLTVNSTAVAGQIYAFSAATTLEGALGFSGTSAVDLRYGADLTVKGGLTIGNNGTVRPTVANTTLSARSIAGTGALNLDNLQVFVTLTGSGAALQNGVVVPASVADQSTFVYAAAASTVASGFEYGNLTLQATSGGIYTLPTPLTIRGNFTQNLGFNAGVELRFTGSRNSTFSVNSTLNLGLLRVNKATKAFTVFVTGGTAQTREVGQTIVQLGTLNVQCESITLHGTTDNEFGVTGQAADDAQVFMQTAGARVTLGDTNVYGNFYVGGFSAGMELTFKDNSTLTLLEEADLEIFGPNAGLKLIIKTETPGTQADIVAAAATVSARIQVSNVQVRDNDASGVTNGITATNSNDDGNNLNWSFQGGGNITGLRATGIGDGQGRLTRVQVLYDSSVDLDAATVGQAHVGYELVQLDSGGDVAISIAGTSASILNVGTPRRTLEVVFGGGLGKTDTTGVQVRYTPPASNRLANTDGRPASISFQLSPVDGAPPVLIGTSFQDVDSNGAIDRGVFFFSEEVGFTARRGVSISGVSPTVNSVDLGANVLLRVRVAGVTLTPDIDFTSGGNKVGGAAMATFIQTEVRNRAFAAGVTPLLRPAVQNFTCTFVDGRYLLRAGVPVAFDAAGNGGQGDYTLDYASSTVVVEAGGGTDAAPALKLGTANDGVETAGSGDGGQGMAWSRVLLDSANTGLSGTQAMIAINGEDPITFSVSAATQSLEDVASFIQTRLRTQASSPQHSSNARSYSELVVIPHRLAAAPTGRLIIVSGGEGAGSKVEVKAPTPASTFDAAFDTGTGGVAKAGAENTQTQLDDLNVFSATGRNLLLGRTDANVVASGSTIVVEFTNAPGDGTTAPRFVWADDGDLGFIADAAPVVNPAAAVSNTGHGQLLALAGDDNADRRLDSQPPGAGSLDTTQSVPPLGATGSSVSLTWSFLRFTDTAGVVDAGVTATTIQLADQTTARPTFTARRAGTYTFQLLAQVRDAGGAAAATPFTDAQGQVVTTVDYVVVDANPVAVAGPDQFVVGLVASLDATASSDPNLAPPANTTLSVQWTAVDQNGAAVAASAFSVASGTMGAAGTPTFTAPTAGVYTITATVFKTADTTKRATDTLTITFTSAADLLPTADAGDDLVRRVGELVTLDGRRSRDPEGQTLLYRWSFVSGPAATSLALDTTDRPSFTPTLAGAYVFELVVEDGAFSSPGDQVTVQVVDDQSAQARRAPGAEPRAAELRRGVFLEAAPASGWELSVEVLMADGTRLRPVVVDLAAVTADDPTAAQLLGTTQVRVFDASLALLGSVFVRIDQSTAAEPVELLNLGGEARVVGYGVAGQAFVLDGTRSQDDGTIRAFTWTQTGGPTAFTSQSGSLVTVVPTTGTYSFNLVVTDATNLSSLPQSLTIPVVPAAGTTGPPLAHIDAASGATEVAGAGTPWSPLVTTGQANAPATLSAAASKSRNGAALASFTWAQTGGPTAVLTGAATDTLSVTGKVAGTYRFRLTVTDTDQVSSSADAWLTLAAPGQVAPVARIDGAASRVVTLGGGGGVDVGLLAGASLGEAPLTLEWGQTAGVPVVIDAATPRSPRVRVDQPGVYTFTLRVTDRSGTTSAPASVAVWVVGQGDAALASGASTSESSGGCALAPVAVAPRGGGAGLLLAALVLCLGLARRRAA